MRSFVSQLKQRRVYRVAIGYAIVAWLAVQIAATVLPAFHAPDFILPVLIVLLGVGFQSRSCWRGPSTLRHRASRKLRPEPMQVDRRICAMRGDWRELA